MCAASWRDFERGGVFCFNNTANQLQLTLDYQRSK